MYRNARGNMLILVSVFMALNAILLILACSYGALFFEQERLQTSANEIALAGARKLNENDRIGQMNNMVARCRQLVWSSRKNFDEVDTSYEHLRHLSEHLLDQAHESAQALEAERLALVHTANSEAHDAMLAKFNEVKGSYPMTLPWLKVAAPTMETPACGKIADVQSNVWELVGYDDLKSADRSAGYIRTYAAADLNLYKENENMRLPGSDASLDFKISSLCAPVADHPSGGGIDGTVQPTNVSVAPARATLAKEFRTVASTEMPSACQVKLFLNVSTAIGGNGQGTAEVYGTAAATGGSIQL